MQTAEAVRVRAGANTDTAADVLERLAGDPSTTVRATVALNPATPASVDAVLARDGDERVRMLLARKVATLLPTLSSHEQTKLREAAYETLAVLVRDEAERVRAAVAEELKLLPDAPRALILQLARDHAVMVCEPVLLFSPTLTTADLVAIVTTEPSHPNVAIIAARRCIAETVSDAIAATTNAVAIRALLSNDSAQIREATLDALAARSADHADWHEPLVQRPMLTPRTAQTLSTIISTHLLEVLCSRADLDPKLARQLQSRLAARLSPPPSARAKPPVGKVWGSFGPDAGRATEDVLLDAIRRGDVQGALETLARAATVPIGHVDRAMALRSTKAMVSLVWKAGFTMRAGLAVQGLLVGVSRDAILNAGTNAEFPLGIAEMRWQIEFIGRAER